MRFGAGLSNSICRALLETERRYAPNEKELLAAVLEWNNFINHSIELEGSIQPI